MKVIFPDYTNCSVNVSNSILKHFGCETYHPTLPLLDSYLAKDYQNVVLIVYDGLGTALLEQHLGTDDFLRVHKQGETTSVFPSTTTPATLSITTGRTPAEHGWLGWNVYIPSMDKIITLFLNTIKGAKEQAADYHVAKHEFPTKTIVDSINEADVGKGYWISPFEHTRYQQTDIEEMHRHILNFCQEEGKKFIYAYSTEPDRLMHKLGTTDPIVVEDIKNINEKTEVLCKKLENTLVIVTADHGHLTVGEYIFLDQYPTLQEMMIRETTLEPRAISFSIKEGRHKDFEVEFNRLFSEDFLLFSQDEVVKRELFGPGVLNEKFTACLGDFVAISLTDKCMVDRYHSTPHKGNHGGICEDEMMVPLIIFESGRGV